MHRDQQPLGQFLGDMRSAHLVVPHCHVFERFRLRFESGKTETVNPNKIENQTPMVMTMLTEFEFLALEKT